MYHHVLFIILLICLETTIVATSLGNQLVAIAGGGEDVVNKCFDKEIHALLDFKASLEDPLGQLSTWIPGDDNCCKWSGVTCNNQTRHVTKIDLSSNLFTGLTGLQGQVNPSLLNLTYLSYIDLSFNSFHGTILNFIGSMTRLSYLDLSFNSFHGTIPNSIGSMTRLTRLALSSNSFNGTIPTSIGFLTKLKYLDLGDNSLHGTIPLELGNLTNLRTLILGQLPRCKVENLDWLSNVSHLQYLDMEKISLAKANHWVDIISSLPKLSFLNLRGCNLSEVMYPRSSFVNSSSSIGFLGLGSNNLNSSMYQWLFSLTSDELLFLDLSGNKLDGIPKYLGNLCSLTSLSLDDNPVVAKFADFLNKLSGCTTVTLQMLDVSYNQLTGSLSDEIHKFSSLQSLVLSHNLLNGTMSGEVWELPNLDTLDVSSNSLIISQNRGKSELGNIDLSNNSLKVIPSKDHTLIVSYIKRIDLSGCKVGPLFPKWLQTHKNLTHLNVANARISDTIPVEFWKTWPSQLKYLNLSSNNVSGKVVDLSSNFDLYATIDLRSNNFYGPIPNVPPTLRSLNLSKNKFYGGISFLCQIVDGFLLFLDLSHNSLTGPIPDCLWHFKELKVLNLGYNNLSGRLPASIGYLVQLEVLHLYSNNLSEELPLALKNCTNLNFMYVGANKFSGNVPDWIGENLTRLYALSLRSNNFFGPIPLQLCQLVNLQILDLSMNNLHGTIPSCVNNLNAIVKGRYLQSQNIHYPLVYNVNVTLLDISFDYVDNGMIAWQGNEREFTSNLGLLMSIDLSRNNLTGRIPNEVVDLHELVALNLSKNALVGEIPRKIGEMKKLLTLDLSRNNLSGAIPSSMSQMASLSYLDMSHNNLSGKIPSSTQLQSFPPSWYSGNVGLCGPPILKNCPEDVVPPILHESENGKEGTDELQRWFFIGGATGFAIGFWMACGALLLNYRGRRAFFHLVDYVKDWIYVKVVVFLRKWERVAHA
ncbi:hypothetical protein OSB04_017535 [Centaurea solstitialis]|uniref:Leucine-rich repeat-containing N-terminal plant-type domain-containing protein n=1 Tax=Centaurea solstitialis TaxID=347529 RepID=A0AA38WIG0_9ASTR|nr:hypothetical protein OSB04_017535 [Centaurea solstitialis]